MRRVLTACLSAGVLAVGSLALTGCNGASNVVIENPAEPVAVIDRGFGNDASLMFADAMLLKNERQAKATGAESVVGIDLDYKANALLVVALGEKPTGGYGTIIDSVQLEGGSLVVNVYTYQPVEGSATTEALSYPYAYAIIPDVTAFEVVVNDLSN